MKKKTFWKKEVKHVGKEEFSYQYFTRKIRILNSFVLDNSVQNQNL